MNVAAATVILPLAECTEENLNAEDESPPDPVSSPPTLGQLDRRFHETQELLARLRDTLMLLTWAVFGIAAILILTRLL